MVVILGQSGGGDAGGLLLGTITALNPTVCTIDGASAGAPVITGYPYVPHIGDRVGLQKAGANYLALPIDNPGAGASTHDTKQHYIGLANEPAFSSNFGNYADGGDMGSWDYVNFHKDDVGVVYINGLGIVGGSTFGAGVPIFTLPPGFRPGYEVTILCANANGLVSMVITEDGRVIPGVSLAAASFQSFDGISFMAEDAFNRLPWVSLASGLASGWTATSTALYGTAPPFPAYYRDRVGNVHLRGKPSGPGGTTAIDMITFPAGVFDADMAKIFAVATAGGYGTGGYAAIQLDNGTGTAQWIYPTSGMTNASASLDGIIFAQGGRGGGSWHALVPGNMANTWAAYPAPFNGVQFTMVNGRCYLRGMTFGGTPAVITNITGNGLLTPKTNALWAVKANGGAARFDVSRSTGLWGAGVQYWNGGNNGFVPVNGIHYDLANYNGEGI